MVCGFHACFSPFCRQWNCALVRQHRQTMLIPVRDSRCACRRIASSASTSRPTPLMRLAVPAKHGLNDVFIQTDGFENLRSFITLQGRDAHLGHHFQHAFGHAFAVGRRRFFRRSISSARMPSVRAWARGFKGEIGIDRIGTIADQQTVMMHFPGFAGFEHQTDPGAFLVGGPNDDAPPRKPAGNSSPRGRGPQPGRRARSDYNPRQSPATAS